jgi:hypothetical protein
VALTFFADKVVYGLDLAVSTMNKVVLVAPE